MNLRVIEETDALTHLALEGDLDIPGVNAVGDKFYFHLTARRKPSIVDVAAVRFMSSLGIGLLVRVSQSLRRHGVGMVLVGAAGKVDEMLRMTNIDKVIPMAATREQALALLR
ncbi:MAG TPA: STAS domain-containing protein [Planctomycetota bacterium]|nr:STAS domain-containing protein [Planctomycetota bacterium]